MSFFRHSIFRQNLKLNYSTLKFGTNSSKFAHKIESQVFDTQIHDNQKNDAQNIDTIEIFTKRSELPLMTSNLRLLYTFIINNYVDYYIWWVEIWSAELFSVEILSIELLSVELLSVELLSVEWLSVGILSYELLSDEFLGHTA